MIQNWYNRSISCHQERQNICTQNIKRILRDVRVFRVAFKVLTERLKKRPMLQQTRERTLRQILLVDVTSDTQMIQSSDWPKRRCVL